MTPIRESRYVQLARLAYASAQASLPVYSHAKSPHRYTLPQLAACVLVGMHQRKSYRDMEELLLASAEIRSVLGLTTQVPNYATLQRTYKKISATDWERMFTTLLLALHDGAGLEEEYVAIDSTYFAPTQASSTFLTKTGRKRALYFTGAFAVGTQSHFILAVCSGTGPGSDVPYLKPLRQKALRFGVQRHSGRRYQTVLADKGFDGRTVREGDLIPVIRRGNSVRNPKLVARDELVAQARLDGKMGQRWKVETVNSVIKRMFGEHIRSRRDDLRVKEPIVKALVYNLHLLFAFFQSSLSTRHPLPAP